jgi:hypothetical protein
MDKLKKYKNKIDKSKSNYSELCYWVDHNLKNYLEDNREDENEILHILDYLNFKNYSRLKKMSYLEASSSSNKWVDSLNSKKKKYTDEVLEVDIKIVKSLESGYCLVDIISKQAYSREGSLMGHCVSSYYNNKKTKILSLRDSKNLPHATIEVENNNVVQIRGKGNKPVISKYGDIVLNALSDLNLNIVESELKNLNYEIFSSDMQHLKTLLLCFDKVKYLIVNKNIYVHNEDIGNTTSFFEELVS